MLKSNSAPAVDAPPASVAPDYLAHWVLKTARTDELVGWYGKVFGARVVHRSDVVTFLAWDHESHRLALVRLPGVARMFFPLAKWRRKAYGLDHIAFGFRSLEKLVDNYARLKSLGVLPVWSINHGPTISFYYEDPDGNRLEFQSENFETAQETAEFFSSAEFADNPIGTNVDPEYLLTQLRAGVPASVLRTREGCRPVGQPVVANMKTINWKTL